VYNFAMIGGSITAFLHSSESNIHNLNATAEITISNFFLPFSSVFGRDARLMLYTIGTYPAGSTANLNVSMAPLNANNDITLVPVWAAERVAGNTISTIRGTMPGYLVTIENRTYGRTPQDPLPLFFIFKTQEGKNICAIPQSYSNGVTEMYLSLDITDWE
jgi:hypothetical protein